LIITGINEKSPAGCGAPFRKRRKGGKRKFIGFSATNLFVEIL
jgi:hypothetical protein